MTIERLVEEAVLADFNLVEDLAALMPKARDHAGRLAGDDEPSDEEEKITIAVSATDDGEGYPNFPGSGIRKINLEVEIRANALTEDVAADRIDELAELAGDRLQPSSAIPGVNGREQNFSNGRLKVGRIKASEPSPRSEEDMVRVRTIARVFEAMQLA